MEDVLNNLFSHYKKKKKIDPNSRYGILSKKALEKEKELRGMLTADQEACFEQLFELTLQLHYLEVKEAFGYACKAGANASKELLI